MLNKKIFTALTTTTLAATAMLALPQAAFAASEELPLPTVEVHVNDLDLTTSEGQKEMQERVRTAAYKVCSRDVYGYAPSLAERGHCLRAALNTGKTQMALKIKNIRYGG